MLNSMELLNKQKDGKQYEELINTKNEKLSSKNSISASVIEFCQGTDFCLNCGKVR